MSFVTIYCQLFLTRWLIWVLTAVEFVEIVESLHSVVSSEDVDESVNLNTRMQ